MRLSDLTYALFTFLGAHVLSSDVYRVPLNRYGYLVSHYTFGHGFFPSYYNYKYSPVSRKLILTGNSLSTTIVRLKFIYFHIYQYYSSGCSDYLDIIGVKGSTGGKRRYCGKGPTDDVTIYPSGGTLTFNFVTPYSGYSTGAGFIIKYTGKALKYQWFLNSKPMEVFLPKIAVPIELPIISYLISSITSWVAFCQQ